MFKRTHMSEHAEKDCILKQQGQSGIFHWSQAYFSCTDDHQFSVMKNTVIKKKVHRQEEKAKLSSFLFCNSM